MLGYIHSMALIIMPAILLWVVVFLSGSGLYFGTCCNKTSGAVISNLALILVLWLVLPAVVGVLVMFDQGYEVLWGKVVFANPLTQATAAMAGLAGSKNANLPWDRVRIQMMDSRRGSSWGFAPMLTLYASVYIGAGLGFLALAKRRMRKKIFGRG